MEYHVDPNRECITPQTGIYVRAKYGESWGNYDIACLTQESLFAWLRSRGGSNPWAENIAAILLGHKPEPYWHQQ